MQTALSGFRGAGSIIETLNRWFRLSLFALPLLSWLFAASAAQAIKNDADEPIRVNARSVEANEKTGMAVYTGDVFAEQGRLSIRAERVEIRTRDNRTDLIRATGKPAKLHRQPDEETPEMQAEANRIDYRVADKKLEMTGDVTVRQGEDLFTGSVLHYDLNAKSLSASGDGKTDGRVHAVLQPRKQTAEPASNP